MPNVSRFGIKNEKDASFEKALKMFRDKTKKYKVLQGVRERSEFVSKSEERKARKNKARLKEKYRQQALG